MGFRDREIEKKFITKSQNLFETACILKDLIGSDHISGQSSDIYWQIPTDSTAFSRLRNNGTYYQLTIKKQDQSNHVNRIEIDLDLQKTEQDRVINYQNIAFGNSVGTVHKFYFVWKLGTSEFNTVSAYTISVNGEPVEGVFIEAEGETIGIVDHMVHKILPLFPDLQRCEGSLYSMYLQPKPRGSCI